MMQMLRTILLTLLLSLSLSGCVYKIDIQQGNIITDKDAQRIHTGMPVSAVKKILGTPLVKNIYKTNHLYYVYTMKRGHNPMSQRKLIIYFKNDRVTHKTFKTVIPKS